VLHCLQRARKKNNKKTESGNILNLSVNLNNMEKYKFFYGGVFSNWYPSEFTINGFTYNCMEQYMMHQKAVGFNDFETARKIMKTKSPKEQKALGREVKNFDSKEYQSVGRLLLDKLYPDYNTISHHHSNLNILDMTSSTIYPFSPRLINLIFNMNAKQFVRKETIGIHWYNGSKISKDFNNTYHLHKGKNLSGFSRIISCGKRTCTIQEYLKDYDDFYTKLNNNM